MKHIILKWLMPLPLIVIIAALSKPLGNWAPNLVAALGILYYEYIIIRRVFISSAIGLFFLSPVIGELVSSSSPPTEFFTPFGVIAQPLLYGLGAIIVRELAFKWNKAWPSLFILGAAYGIVEEGLACKSFFNENWMDIGIFGEYGRYLGVNWVWTVHLTIYHMFVSIIMPIMLMMIIFPKQKTESWVTPNGFKWVCGIFIVHFSLLFATLVPPKIYYPPLHLTIITIAVVFLLGYLAYKIKTLPPPNLSISGKYRLKPWVFYMIGLFGTIVDAVLNGLLPELGVHPIMMILIIVTFIYAISLLVVKLSDNGRWNDMHKLALAGGILTFFGLIDFLRELKPFNADNPSGLMIVGLYVFLFLFWLRSRIKNRQVIETDLSAE